MRALRLVSSTEHRRVGRGGTGYPFSLVGNSFLRAPPRLSMTVSPTLRITRSIGLAGLPSDPEALVAFVRRSVSRKVMDASMWNGVAARSMAMGDVLSGHQFAAVVRGFNKMNFGHSDVYPFLESFVPPRLPRFTPVDLSHLISGYVHVAHRNDEGFLMACADDLSCDRRKLASSVGNVHATNDWYAWENLWVAYAEANVKHKKLFEVAAPKLYNNVHSIKGRNCARILGALIKCGFIHKRLVAGLRKALPTMSCSKLLSFTRDHHPMCLNIFGENGYGGPAASGTDELQEICRLLNSMGIHDEFADKLLRYRKAEILDDVVS